MTLRLGGDGAITGCTSLENPDLTVSGLTISGSFDAEKVLVASGTAAAPSYTFSGDTDNGLYYAGTNSIGVSTAGTSAIVVDSSQQVGIGTTSPSSKLHVKGTADSYVTLEAGTTDGNDGILFKNSGGTQKGALLYDTDDNYLLFNVNSGERMRLDSSGRLGIGTTSPDRKLHVAGDWIRVDDGYGLDTSGSTEKVKLDNGYISLTTASSERARIDSSGNVGIGTQSPGFNLHVVGATSNIFKVERTGAGGTAKIRIENGDDNYWDIANDGDESLTFGRNFSEKLRIDSSGRLLIGTTNGSITQAVPLQVEGTSFVTSGASLRRNSNDAGAPALRLCKSRGTSTGSYSIVSNGDAIGLVQFCAADGNSDKTGAEIRAEIDGTPGTNDMPGRLMFSTTADGASSPTERMRIRSSGLVSIPGVYSFTTAASANVIVQSAGQLSRATSSAKYKTSIETLEDSYADSILECRPVWYRSTSELDNPNYGWWGFIAEEVAEIDPRLVFWKTTEVTYDENGSAVESPCDPEPEGVAYDRFVPHLLNLIKRQKEQIETLEQRLKDAGL